MTNLIRKTRLAKFWFEQKTFSRICFIHVNKCGGTSVEKALGIPKVHDTVSQRIEWIGEAVWKRMYTFSIVRNPYTRVISHYKYRVKTNQTGLGKQDLSLNDWIYRAYAEKDPEYYNNPLMFAPCVDWLTVEENGEIAVDKVIKLESIDAEWDALIKESGISYRSLPHANTTTSNRIEEAKLLLDKASIEIVSEHFAKDFRRFDYEL